MTYVMSDLHGQYEQYIKMLDIIGFSDDDILYVLGDVVDRGPNPIRILTDMSCRPNIYPIAGNHEIMALEMLRVLVQEITDENCESTLTPEFMSKLVSWQMDGAETTMRDFKKLSIEDRISILEYIEEFSPYETVLVGNKKYILVHSGLGNFSKTKKLSQYSLEELMFLRSPDEYEFDDADTVVIAGHTPTLAFTEKPEIFYGKNYINIDCGAVFGGKLACLRLEDGKEFYC